MRKENKGFIKLDRNIFEHWIFQDAEKFRAFVDLIQLARWKEEKLLIGNEVVTVPRGSYYTSELKLAERWNWSRKRTREFLKLLENEKMITKKGTTKGTMLTIENYRVYQDEGTTISTSKGHQRDSERTAKDTSKGHQRNSEGYTKEEIKEIKEFKEREERKENNTETINVSSGSSEDFNIFRYMQRRGFVSISPIIAEQVQNDIEMYSLEEVKQAIDIADNNGKHTYSYVKGILQKRRAENPESDNNIWQEMKKKIEVGEDPF